MKIFILIQDRESSTLTAPFTSKEKAVEFALSECRHYDDEEGVVEYCDYDNVVAVINSDSIETSYFVITEEVDKVFTP